jgi:hypothetical protein
MPEAKQNTSKLAEMFARASSFSALVGMAVDVVGLFMALLSFVGIITPSLSAQGEQRRFSYFNIDRDILLARSSRRTGSIVSRNARSQSAAFSHGST